MKNNLSSKLLNNIIIVGIILTLLALIATPVVLTGVSKGIPDIIRMEYVTNITVGIYICSIPYILALFLLKKICNKVAIKDPFSRDIPKYLKQIAMCAFSEILIFNATQLVLYYFFDIYLYGLSIVLAVVVSFVSLAIGLLSLVLGRLMEVAIEIKEENDKTI